MKTLLLAVFCTFLLVPFVFASIGTGGNYNSQTRFSFLGYNATDAGSGYQSRGSDQITGSFSIGTTYTGRLGILKSCGNSIIDSGETCDSANLNGQTCATRGYSSGTLACKADCSDFDTSSCATAPAAVVKPVATPGGSSTGAAPSPTEFSSVTNVEINTGSFVVMTTAQSAGFTKAGRNYIVDIKQIAEDFVKVWVYSPDSDKAFEPIETIIPVGKRANIDLDHDSWADISIELRGIAEGNAFLYIKELQAPSKVSMPTGQQVTVEEQFETPKVTTLTPQSLIPENFWSDLLKGYENFVREKVDYWISQAKTKISWLLPSAAFLALLLLFFERSLSFYMQKKSKKNP